ncbi:hypothetical protein D3C80_1672870 [compost metagenome]
MNIAVDQQHRPGLRGKVRLDAGFDIGIRFQHARLVAFKIKHTIWLQMEIAPTAPGADGFKLTAIFHIQTNR